MQLATERHTEEQLDDFRADILWEGTQLLNPSFDENSRILAVADLCYDAGERLYALTDRPYGCILLTCELGALARHGDEILEASRERDNATVH
jgi:hypothetical protein